MFNVKAEPVANVPPYKRIPMGIIEPAPRDANVIAQEAMEIIDQALVRIEAARIWGLVKDTASGTCMPISSPSSTSSPTDCDDTVCTDGWEAG